MRFLIILPEICLRFAAHLFEFRSVAKMDGKIICWQND